jgi:hypothetical protein
MTVGYRPFRDEGLIRVRRAEPAEEVYYVDAEVPKKNAVGGGMPQGGGMDF